MRTETHELAEWRAAAAELTEFERAPHDEPQTYADLHSPSCVHAGLSPNVRADNSWTSERTTRRQATV